MPEARVIKMRLSLNSRPINTYKFSKEVIMVGRDPGADIVVDNPGISREHAKFELTPNGEYRLVDLGSANGTFLNDERIKAAYVRNNDVVRLGKFTIWIGMEADRRGNAPTGEQRTPTPLPDQTTVLSRSEVEHLMSAAREAERETFLEEKTVFVEQKSKGVGVGAGPLSVIAEEGARRSRVSLGLMLGIGLLAAVVGAGVAWLLLR